MNQQKHIIKSPSPPGPTTQQGQVMPFAVVFILLICAVFFFSVNTQQMAIEKTRTNTAADAAAYSAGVVQARALNFTAYTNRAIVANQVAIAQTLTLVNWINYAGSFYSATKATAVGPIVEAAARIFNPGGGVKFDGDVNEWTKKSEIMGFYAVMTIASLVGQFFNVQPDMFTGTVLPAINMIGSVLITWMDAALFFLEESQHLLFAAHGALLLERTQDIASKAVQRTDPSLKAHLIPTSLEDVSKIVRRYEGKDRKRLKYVVMASLDKTTKDRGWNIESLIQVYIFAGNPRAEITRVGRTWMDDNDLDHWHSEDILGRTFRDLKLSTTKGIEVKVSHKALAAAKSTIGGDSHLNWRSLEDGGQYKDTDPASVSPSAGGGVGTGNQQAQQEKVGCGDAGGGGMGGADWFGQQAMQKFMDYIEKNNLVGVSKNAKMEIMCHGDEDMVRMPGFFPVYAGMSKTYDVKDPKNYEPKAHRAAVSVLVYKDKEDTTTAGHNAALSPSGRLALYGEKPHLKMVGISRAEVLFRRPAKANGDMEYPNLYNPYWTVRLIAPTQGDMDAGKAMVVGSAVVN